MEVWFIGSTQDNKPQVRPGGEFQGKSLSLRMQYSNFVPNRESSSFARSGIVTIAVQKRIGQYVKGGSIPHRKTLDALPETTYPGYRSAAEGGLLQSVLAFVQ